MFESLLDEELSVLQRKDLLRSLKPLTLTSSIRANWENKDLVLFCGNDYLGLSRHPDVIAAAKSAAEEAGIGSGAARLISGTSDYHEKIEKELADFRKKEKALIFSAGYLANLGAISGLAGERDLILMDKLCHASLIDGIKLSGAELRVFPHKNYGKCDEILKKNNGHRKRFIVSDTVFSMDGDIAELQELVGLKKKHDAFLIVDDAHGMGVLGKEGSGALEEDGLEKEVDLITGTLSKSLGCLGGFVSGSETVINYLINHARPFIFATALPPLVCAAALEGLRIIRSQPELRKKLWSNIHYFKSVLSEKGIKLPAITSAIFSIIIGEEKEALKVSQQLAEMGYLVPAVRYPAVSKGKARLRVTVSACHDERQIEGFAAALSSIL